MSNSSKDGSGSGGEEPPSKPSSGVVRTATELLAEAHERALRQQHQQHRTKFQTTDDNNNPAVYIAHITLSLNTDASTTTGRSCTLSTTTASAATIPTSITSLYPSYPTWRYIAIRRNPLANNNIFNYRFK